MSVYFGCMEFFVFSAHISNISPSLCCYLITHCLYLCVDTVFYTQYISQQFSAQWWTLIFSICRYGCGRRIITVIFCWRCCLCWFDCFQYHFCAIYFVFPFAMLLWFIQCYCCYTIQCTTLSQFCFYRRMTSFANIRWLNLHGVKTKIHSQNARSSALLYRNSGEILSTFNQ